jgi:high frequency lysogenization protein
VRGPAAELGVAHPEVIARLGACYQQTLSTLRPRIIVHGEPATLGDPDNRQRIRALLLAAIRAAVLWRQCGGGRLTLLLHRRQLLQSLAQLQDELQRAP